MSAIDWSPLWISLHTAAATITIVFFIGVIIAWWVERLQSQSLKIFADAVITLPMVLPPTVAGFFLLYFFGNNRFLGQLIYQLTGIKIAFSWMATVLAAAVISLPLMYRSARGALSQVDKGMLEAARSLGMTEWRIFWRIHLPNALPGIIAGGLLAFARGLGEFGATAMIAGNIAGRTRTLPLAVYSAVAAGDWEAAGCGGSDKLAAAPQAAKTLRLAAAASMEKVFAQKLIPMYQQRHPEIKIEGVYDASGKLQAQIESGLAADVFISAANKQMNALSEKGYMDKSTVKPLLENKLVLIVPKSGSEIKGFNDFGKAKHPAIGDPASVPAGQYAKEALTKLGQWEGIQGKVSLGTNVTQVLNWVAEGSADAGLVYATDAALLKDKVTAVAEAPAGSLKKPVIYPIGVLAKAPQAEAAKDFAAFLQTEEAMKIFAAYGFAQAK